MNDPKSSPLSRREFLKLTGLAAAGLALPGQALPRQALLERLSAVGLAQFPDAERLGRAAKGTLEVKARPDFNSETVDTLFEDSVVPWLREVVGVRPEFPAFNNQRWVQVPGGYVYGAHFQPVRNLPNVPLASLPQTSRGGGMWAEVTVPYVDVSLQTTPSSGSWMEALVDQGLPVRAYYGQIFWIDQVRTTGDGAVQYRVNPNYYGGVDMFWAPAEALRPLAAEDLAPIHPEAENKQVVVDITRQMLSCYEGSREVFFCRVSTGAAWDMYGQLVDAWLTPLGEHWISRKFVSLQMSGGTTGAGYDMPGIGWTVIFATGGVALHSTFWHNNYGDMMSHGCVNLAPANAQWVWRWCQPSVSYDPGMLDATLTGDASTKVIVREG